MTFNFKLLDFKLRSCFRSRSRWRSAGYYECMRWMYRDPAGRDKAFSQYCCKCGSGAMGIFQRRPEKIKNTYLLIKLSAPVRYFYPFYKSNDKCIWEITLHGFQHLFCVISVSKFPYIIFVHLFFLHFLYICYSLKFSRVFLLLLSRCKYLYGKYHLLSWDDRLTFCSCSGIYYRGFLELSAIGAPALAIVSFFPV